ncbi:MAG: hypothetical protein EZS28_050986 [Streblomastix strix]|uniref:Uncharacterized protein n=1 Tax=Streblomastix strix TaxID=222440 RepID=A0A5J4T5I8_9EUKA|nr:MAG: hypothetical protein EZS28_050986 [Streblomastix strix]
MTVPSEYNVIGGLLGLGQDILLILLSELMLIPNAVQFVGSCKKTLQLKNHQRFYKIIETLNYPIEIHNTDPIDFEITDIDGFQKKISKKFNKDNAVSLTQILEDGIWSIETMFNTTTVYNGNCGIGIMSDSYSFPAGTNPYYGPHFGKGLFVIKEKEHLEILDSPIIKQQDLNLIQQKEH